MKVTVPSLPKENGVLVKRNIAKMIVLDFTGVCFDQSCTQIVLPVKKLKRLSQKAQEIREFG